MRTGRHSPFPIPLITDFGLAKLLGQDASQTQTGAVLGTPSYMAPEQARGALSEVSAATDVYALGAILYEMLTGRPPFSGATPLDTLDQVRAQDPVPPSRLQPRIPRDLETICLKCLRKESARRYGSAADLGDDLRRFRNGEPIRARQVGVGERTWKWVRRRPVVASLAACSLATVVALLLVGLVYHLRLQRALNATERQRARAEDHYQKMLDAVDAMLSEVGDEDLADVPEMEEERASLLEKALRFYENLLHEKDDPDPAIRRETARAFWRTARISSLLGRMDLAEAQVREALSLYRQLRAEFPEEMAYRREQAYACAVLAGVLDQTGRVAEAVAVVWQAKAFLDSLPLEKPQDRQDRARNCNYLGVHSIHDNPKGAEGLFHEALALVEVRDGEVLPAGAAGVLTEIYLNLGNLHQEASRLELAEAAYAKARTYGDIATGEARRMGSAHVHLAKVYHNLAALHGTNRPKEAKQLYEKALALRKELARRHPRVPSYSQEVVASHECLVWLALATGDTAEAEHHLKAAIALLDPLVKAHSPLVTPVQLAHDSMILGQLYAQRKRLVEAETTLKKAVSYLEPLVREQPRNLGGKIKLAESLLFLHKVQVDNQKPKEALATLTQSITRLETILKDDPTNGYVVTLLKGEYLNRADLLSKTGRGGEALADLILASQATRESRAGHLDEREVRGPRAGYKPEAPGELT
jgi:tetratricopeptide (TPR) repeat protein